MIKYYVEEMYRSIVSQNVQVHGQRQSGVGTGSEVDIGRLVMGSNIVVDHILTDNLGVGIRTGVRTCRFVIINIL